MNNEVKVKFELNKLCGGLVLAFNAVTACVVSSVVVSADVVAQTASSVAQTTEKTKVPTTVESKSAGMKAGALPQDKVDNIKSNIEKTFQVKVLSVNPTPFADLYEVLTDETIIYTNADHNYILAGHLIDAKSTVDLTDKRVKEQSAKAFASLPVEGAVKRVKGKGTRKLVTFEDPNCPYCKALYKELEQMDDVTIYTFLVPLLAKDSVTKVRDIMCSSNPTLSWHEWVTDGKKPQSQANKSCSEPNPKTFQLARSVNVQGVPVILFPNGERRNGFVRLADIEKIISSK
ncbi:DsbC family protein [Taylorella equigenitalis]|nr:DsbC family protein [Taylorella equigenitalis]WDU53574.1 DsbC family protein [Taylorella equigenitalis]